MLEVGEGAQEHVDPCGGGIAALQLPGAINIPLKQLTEQATASLDKQRPVVVYCSDYQ